MGGWGSGRSSAWSRKIEDSVSVDIRELQRAGHFRRPGSRAEYGLFAAAGNCIASVELEFHENEVCFTYQVRDRHGPVDRPWGPRHCTAMIARTVCHFGGTRPWFICPHRDCGRRVTRLVLFDGVVGCRYCHQLAYSSQSEDAADRARRRERRIRRKLGMGKNLFEPIQHKPPHMHWRTFFRLRDEASRYGRISLADLQRPFSKLGRK